MHVYLSQGLLDGLTAYCLEHLPYEACGLIVGTIHGNEMKPTAWIPVENIADHPEHHFEMNPRELIPQLFSETKGNGQIIGLFHSHPNTAAIPSKEDVLTLWNCIPSYWILSLDRPTQLQIYQIKKAPEPLFEKLSFSMI